MPPSQLKRLKASLREQGIVGPQQSKKQKKQNARDGADKEKRVQRSVALTGIREQFNPFEYKLSARGPKFDVTTSDGRGGKASKGIGNRPGLRKSLGEENRRKTLLVEMQRRNKVGGIIDKRFGENDPTMAPEDRMMERFTQEKQRQHKNSSMFDLEDDNEDAGGLTHLGQSLSLDGPTLTGDDDRGDDFDEEGLELSDAEDHASENGLDLLKRRRSSGSESMAEGGESDDSDEGQPQRKKTKQEVMKEVMAKSKMYKYERQAAKDEDEDLREELDKELPDLHALLRGGVLQKASSATTVDIGGMDPGRAALLSGADRRALEKDYDLRLKQMAQDKKSKPTERSKTEEQKAAEESQRLQDLEAKRLRRMQGEDQSSDDERADIGSGYEDEELFEDFGVGSGIKMRTTAAELDVEDEDNFIIEDDLVASGTEEELTDLENSSLASEGEERGEEENDDDDEFVKGLLTTEEASKPEFASGVNGQDSSSGKNLSNGVNGTLAYTFPCPQSQAEFVEITKGVATADLPIVVQRIRALYHPRLRSENKPKMANFTAALIDYISYLADQSGWTPFVTLESLIRHVHSLAKSWPTEAANTFRQHLASLEELRAENPTRGDLVILTAIGNVFPTSDHFHQVVTPATLVMAKYLGQKIPETLADLSVGTYISTLFLQYQRLAKRYIPELVGFLLNSLCALSPTAIASVPGCFAHHASKQFLRIHEVPSNPVRQLSMHDFVMSETTSDEQYSQQKAALLELNVKLIDTAADLWNDKLAFIEIFAPALVILTHLDGKSCRGKLSETSKALIRKTTQKVERISKHARLARRPLELHHHKPLAIKTSIPKFEETFNPDKHYDPDRERHETAKLRAELKREKKGALRELRKDANFIARESLRQKKEKDAAYETKYKRLVAEIQGEEGREAKAYEREKEWRKKGKR